jgi:membrane fusion protein (multidrug efflux system)
MEPESEKKTMRSGAEDPPPGAAGQERADGSDGPRRRYPRGVLRSGSTVLLLVAVLIGAFAVYWFRYRPWVSTDDAQVDGHIATVSARIGGYVAQVNTDDNRKVEAGAVLAEIDPSGYKIALDKAEAEYADAIASAEAARTGVPIASVTTAGQLTSARAAVENGRAGVSAAGRQLEGAQAREREAEANNARAQKDLQRYAMLLSRDVIARQTYDLAVATAKTSAASLDAARSAVHAAAEQVVQARGLLAQAEAELRTAGTGPEQVSITRARADSAAAAVEKARTALEQARLNLQYTKILAPVSGIVGNRTVEVGQNVSPGQTLLSIVQVGDLWVTANFKETQIRGMKPGQPVRIYVDANGHTYEGRVDSIGAASGARFSLFPPENATGNYVKVVQRVPVKIVFSNGQDVERMLRPGMSVEPSVKVR